MRLATYHGAMLCLWRLYSNMICAGVGGAALRDCLCRFVFALQHSRQCLLCHAAFNICCARPQTMFAVSSCCCSVCCATSPNQACVVEWLLKHRSALPLTPPLSLRTPFSASPPLPRSPNSPQYTSYAETSSNPAPQWCLSH